MGRDRSEKEKILRGLLEEHEQNPLIFIEPDDFFLLKENNILDSEVMQHLQSDIETLIGDGCFIFIDKDEVNAFAMEKDGIPIIALH